MATKIQMKWEQLAGTVVFGDAAAATGAEQRQVAILILVPS